ncbi:hypothetical protein IAT40_006192 [Kwoniella sp. CBS 6097]
MYYHCTTTLVTLLTIANFPKLKRSTASLALRGRGRASKRDHLLVQLSPPSIPSIRSSSYLPSHNHSPSIPRPCSTRLDRLRLVVPSRPDRVFFSSSASSAAQALPDESWDHPQHHQPQYDYGFDAYRSRTRQRQSSSELQSQQPSNIASSSRRQLIARPRHEQEKREVDKNDRRGSRKGKERALDQSASTAASSRSWLNNTRTMDGPDLAQAEFEVTDAHLDEIFQSYQDMNYAAAAEDNTSSVSPEMQYGQDFMSDEIDGAESLLGLGIGLDHEGIAEADEGWDLSPEVLAEMGLDGPMPSIPPEELAYNPFAAAADPSSIPSLPAQSTALQPGTLQRIPEYEPYQEIDSTQTIPLADTEIGPQTQLTTQPLPHGAELDLDLDSLAQPEPTLDSRHYPPLPAPQYPPDGQTRFDWRLRAPSQRSSPRQRRGRWGTWFAELPKRKEAAFGKIGMADWGRDELDRYQRHFIPLLEAEQAEEQRLYDHRLAEWSFDRLQRDGYATDDLRGTKDYQPKSLVGMGVVYSFAKPRGELPFHRFTIGSNVIISRTDPKVDPITVNGKEQPPEPLMGSVWNVSKGKVRVMFSQGIPDLQSGSWRLDLGCSDFAIKKQIEAIKSLNLDPFEQDMMDLDRSSAKFDPAPTPVTQQRATAHATPEDEVEAIRSATISNVRNKKDEKEQTILRGTAIRDLLFRAFQGDYVPPDRSSDSANALVDHSHVSPSDHIVPDPSDLQPFDLDAIPRPPVQREPDGILSRNQLIQSWTSRYRAPGTPIPVEGDPVVPLNESQTRAIAMMLSERLSLVQGPPGTGKTRVIIETIKLLKKHWQIPHPILVTAHTNVAVDNLLVGLRAHGIKALRFGAMNRVSEESSEYTLDRMMGQHPSWWDLEGAKKEKEQIAEKIFLGKQTTEDLERDKKLSQKIWMIRQNIIREVLLDADVICTTCLSATSKSLQGIDFPIVFLDEASMATEPLSLVPLTKGSSHVAIIGDHKQLPPVIISPEAHAGGLSTSLFERLIHEGHVPSIMLDTQYRMHPLLSTFPSKSFYSSLLKDGTDPLLRPAPETAFLVPVDPEAESESEPVERCNMTFLNHDHPESPVSKSLANYGDAEIVCDVVADLLYKNPDLTGSQIGLITPYLSQIRLLTNHLADPERRQAFIDVLGHERAREIDEIEIRTVDGFEGREKEVIIFSTVRCNVGGWIGFLSDWRRVNVGLTRAKRALIMVGSKSTLEKARIGKTGEAKLPSGGAKVWRDLMGWLGEKGMIMDVD